MQGRRSTDNHPIGVLVGVAVACCAVVALALLGAPPSAHAATTRARAPSAAGSCGMAVGAPRAAVPAAHAGPGAPQLALSPAQGAAGTKIVATGTGWPAGATLNLTARVNGQGIFSVPARAATVTADGTFTLTFPAPGTTCTFTPTVGLVMQFQATATGSNQTGSATFTYDVPSPALAPPPGPGGLPSRATSLPVRGTNWGAGTAVTVWATTPSTPANAHDPWLPPSGVPTAVLTADSGGLLIGNVPLSPSLLPLRPGTWLGLAASASGPGFGQVITFLPSAYHVGLGQLPTVVASGPAVAQGATLHVSGDYWWPGDTLRLLYCQGAPHPTKLPEVRCNPAQSTTLGTAQVDSAGHFAATVTMPAGAPAGAGTLEATVSGQFDDPFTATQALAVAPTANPGSWLALTLGPATPLLALALLAAAAVLAALWWIAQQRAASRARQQG